MVTLNHTNLTTYDVPGLAEFFCTGFAFEAVSNRNDRFVVLRNADGFLLTLMFDKNMTKEHGYPGIFHVGFLQPTQKDVDAKHEELTAKNYAAPKPELLHRGGPPTYGFYTEAPGGVLVEVSTMKVEQSVEV